MTDLWCVHVIGQDDVHPAPSKTEAERAVAFLLGLWASRYPKEYADGMIDFEATPWPHSPESHAKDVDKFYAAVGLSPPADNTIEQQPDSDAPFGRCAKCGEAITSFHNTGHCKSAP